MEAEITSKESLLAEIETEWDKLESLLDSLEDEVLEDPVLEAGWSAKDTLAHIMSWEQQLLEWVGALLADEEPQRAFTGDDWIDRINEQVFNQYREVPLADVLDAFEESHEAVLEMLEALSPETLFDPERFDWLQDAPLWRMVAENTFWHYRDHRETLSATLS